MPKTSTRTKAAPKTAKASDVAPKSTRKKAPAYRVPATRQGARQLGGFFPTPDVLAFRALAVSQEKDVQQLVAEGVNLVFKKYGLPNRVPVHSGRRTPRPRDAS